MFYIKGGGMWSWCDLVARGLHPLGVLQLAVIGLLERVPDFFGNTLLISLLFYYLVYFAVEHELHFVLMPGLFKDHLDLRDLLDGDLCPLV